MFTKQHYEAIADIIRNLDGFRSPQLWEQTVRQFAAYFQEDNPNFKRDRFVARCTFKYETPNKPIRI